MDSLDLYPDLEHVIQGYVSRQGLLRLNFIVSQSKALEYKREAASIALEMFHKNIDHATTDGPALLDDGLYKSFSDTMIRITDSNQLKLQIATNAELWLEKSAKQKMGIHQKIVEELEISQGNNIQDSVCVCYQELGKFHHSCGQLPASSIAYKQALEYCIIPTQRLEIYYKLMQVCIEQLGKGDMDIACKGDESVLYWGTKAVQLYHSERKRLQSMPRYWMIISQIYSIMGLTHLISISDIGSDNTKLALSSLERFSSIRDALYCFIHAILCDALYETTVIAPQSQFQNIYRSTGLSQSQDDPVITKKDLLFMCILCFFATSIAFPNLTIFSKSDPACPQSFAISQDSAFIQTQYFESHADLYELIRLYNMGEFRSILLQLKNHFIPIYGFDMSLGPIIESFVNIDIKINFFLCTIYAYHSISFSSIASKLAFDTNALDHEAFLMILNILDALLSSHSQNHALLDKEQINQAHNDSRQFPFIYPDNIGDNAPLKVNTFRSASFIDHAMLKMISNMKIDHYSKVIYYRPPWFRSNSDFSNFPLVQSIGMMKDLKAQLLGLK
jgi:hypothetical protein